MGILSLQVGFLDLDLIYNCREVFIEKDFLLQRSCHFGGEFKGFWYVDSLNICLRSWIFKTANPLVHVEADKAWNQKEKRRFVVLNEETFFFSYSQKI